MLIHLNLGSNLEPRLEHLRRALDRLAASPQITIVGSSRIYETPPIELTDPAPGPFFNLCAALRTSLRPEKVLERTAAIEQELGRPPAGKGARRSRVIDIDLVLAEKETRSDPALRLPHPGLLVRSFFLWPLVEICPNAACPVTGLPVRFFLRRLVLPPILRTLPALSPR
jgi:2-amino-4-hydroxy-6-hydroxymethyldihydropteridine diphosphokinase